MLGVGGPWVDGFVLEKHAPGERTTSKEGRGVARVAGACLQGDQEVQAHHWARTQSRCATLVIPGSWFSLVILLFSGADNVLFMFFFFPPLFFSFYGHICGIWEFSGWGSNLSGICDPHCNSGQCQILNTLSKARD